MGKNEESINHRHKRARWRILSLAKFLLDKDYEVFGTYRRLSTPNFWRLQYLDIFEKVNLIPADLVDAGSMVEAVKIFEPNEIYHLAAQSFVGASFEQPIGTRIEAWLFGSKELANFGEPVISGTRIPVDLIIGKLAGGMTYEEVMAEYEIKREDILAVLNYAAKTISCEEIKTDTL